MFTISSLDFALSRLLPLQKKKKTSIGANQGLENPGLTFQLFEALEPLGTPLHIMV